MKFKVLLFFLIMILPSSLRAEERLLYALRYESLERYPDIVNTKIYSLDPTTKKERLVFSDENIAILLFYKGGMPGYPGEVLAASRKRLFAYAVDKSLKPGRRYSGKASIYELSLDGSNNFRIERTYHQLNGTDLWIKALDSGREERVFSLPNQQSKEYYLGVVGWMGQITGGQGPKIARNAYAGSS